MDRNDEREGEVAEYLVALRKESVDRNCSRQCHMAKMNASLSARRAWIEMWSGAPTATCLLVALRKESVDRNP